MNGAMSDLDRWEARFAIPDYLFGTEPNAFLKSQTHLLSPGMKALAVADGEGRNGVFLAGLGLDVLSIEFSPSALVKARALAKARGVAMRFEQADIHAWNWPRENFDAVVAIFIQFSPPAERARVFDGIRRTLKPGGLLLMQGYGTAQLKYKTGGPSEVEQLYTRTLLEHAFAGFVSVAIDEHDSMISEGTRHVGKAALIDLVARK